MRGGGVYHLTGGKKTRDKRKGGYVGTNFELGTSTPSRKSK